MRERGSLGPSGGAAGVEQPGRVLWLPADERRRRRRREPVPPLTGRHHHRLHRRDGADQRLDVAGMVGVGHSDGRLAVFEDEADLVAVEAGVDRHGHETRVPDREQRLEVLGSVAHHDGDPVTGRQAEVVAQASGRAGRPGGEQRPSRRGRARRRPAPGRRVACGRGAPPRRQGSSHRFVSRCARWRRCSLSTTAMRARWQHDRAHRWAAVLHPDRPAGVSGRDDGTIAIAAGRAAGRGAGSPARRDRTACNAEQSIRSRRGSR